MHSYLKISVQSYRGLTVFPDGQIYPQRNFHVEMMTWPCFTLFILGLVWAQKQKHKKYTPAGTRQSQFICQNFSKSRDILYLVVSVAGCNIKVSNVRSTKINTMCSLPLSGQIILEERTWTPPTSSRTHCLYCLQVLPRLF